MSMVMRAKLKVSKVVVHDWATQIEMQPVTTSPFGPDGESEDNSYARWTPSGLLQLTISNPNLMKAFEVGQIYYVDFTAPEQKADETRDSLVGA